MAKQACVHPTSMRSRYRHTAGLQRMCNFPFIHSPIDVSLQPTLLQSQEASFICRGSAARVMEMGTVAQEQLWGAVQGGASDLKALCDVLDSLQLAPSARGGRPAAVPLRVYVNAQLQGAFPSYAAVWYTSRPWESESDGKAVTLEEVVDGVLQMVPSSAELPKRDECCVLVGGVRPPGETPLAWLHEHMRCLDQFLYITILVV